MSILPGDVVDLHEYEHECIRRYIQRDQILMATARWPQSGDPAEAAAIAANRMAAERIWHTYWTAAQAGGRD